MVDERQAARRDRDFDKAPGPGWTSRPFEQFSAKLHDGSGRRVLSLKLELV